MSVSFCPSAPPHWLPRDTGWSACSGQALLSQTVSRTDELDRGSSRHVCPTLPQRPGPNPQKASGYSWGGGSIWSWGPVDRRDGMASPPNGMHIDSGVQHTALA